MFFFTSPRKLSPAFCAHNAQSSPVASTCTSPESRTNRSTGAPGSNRFHRDRHSVADLCSCCSPGDYRLKLLAHRHAFAGTADTLGNPVRAGHLYLSLWWCTPRNLDRKSQQPACLPSAVTISSHRRDSDIWLVGNALPQRFVWNNPRTESEQRNAMILGSSWQRPV